MRKIRLDQQHYESKKLNFAFKTYRMNHNKDLDTKELFQIFKITPNHLKRMLNADTSISVKIYRDITNYIFICSEDFSEK